MEPFRHGRIAHRTRFEPVERAAGDERLLRAVVAAEPEQAEGWSALAEILRSLGETDAAIEAGERAVALRPVAANLQTGKVDTALSTASCQAPFDLALSNRTVSTTVTCEASTLLTAGDKFVVVSPGDLTFRAGQRIDLADGFEVQSGSFEAEIDPILEP